MSYAQVVFPLSLKPLTYKIPSESVTTSLIGSIVKAPLMGRSRYGLVFGLQPDVPLDKNIKSIEEVSTGFVDQTFVDFLRWMAGYYLSSEGMALKASFFKEATLLLTRDKKKGPKTLVEDKAFNTPIPSADVDNQEAVKGLLSILSEQRYKTILIHPKRENTERAVVIELLRSYCKDSRGVIVLSPEIHDATAIYHSLRQLFNSRVGLLHSSLRPSEILYTLDGVLKGQIDIVVGSRSALFAPLVTSLIVVTSEHSPSYKAEEGLRYNARDAAVRLGLMRNCPVVLTSISPSLESIYNVKINKYSPYELIDGQRCKVKIIHHTFRQQLKSALSAEVKVWAKNLLNSGGALLFVGQREGFSLLYCLDCATVVRCTECNNSLIYFEDTKKVSCPHCKLDFHVGSFCDYCKGFNLAPIGGGIERIKKELKEEFIKNQRILDDTVNSHSQFGAFVVKRGKALKAVTHEVDAAVIVDFDLILRSYGFRANEVALQECMKIASKVKPSGWLLIQTSDPTSILARALKSYDFKSFYDYELRERQSAGYPPFRKITLIECLLKNEALQQEIDNSIAEVKAEGIKLLGPVQSNRQVKGYKKVISYIIKSQSKAGLDAFVRAVRDKLKDLKGLRADFEVDPLMI